MTSPLDFTYSDKPEPHRSRTKSILKAHPEIRQLIGKNPMTFWYTVGIVTLQIVVAYLVRAQPWCHAAGPHTTAASVVRPVITMSAPAFSASTMPQQPK